MRALILAAGRGSRMRTLTAQKPKCLVEIAGRSLLDWQLEALRAGGVTDIALVRGYRGELLADRGCRTFDNPRWALTNMVGTLLCAHEWLSAQDCLVSYADIVYHPAAVGALIEAPGAITIAYDRLWKQLWTDRFEDPLGDAESFRCSPDGRVLDIGRRASSLNEVEGQYMGLLKFTPDGWRQIAEFLNRVPPASRDRLDMTSLLGQLIVAGIPISAVPVDGRWCEVDSDEDLLVYQQRLAEPMPWRHDWRWEEAA